MTPAASREGAVGGPHPRDRLRQGCVRCGREWRGMAGAYTLLHLLVMALSVQDSPLSCIPWPRSVAQAHSRNLRPPKAATNSPRLVDGCGCGLGACHQGRSETGSAPPLPAKLAAAQSGQAQPLQMSSRRGRRRERTQTRGAGSPLGEAGEPECKSFRTAVTAWRHNSDGHQSRHLLRRDGAAD